MEVIKRTGHNIRKIRKAKKISQEELAAEAHISVRTLGNIERGLSNPTLRVLYSISLALGVSLDDLISYDRAAGEDEEAWTASG